MAKPSPMDDEVNQGGEFRLLWSISHIPLPPTPDVIHTQEEITCWFYMYDSPLRWILFDKFSS